MILAIDIGNTTVALGGIKDGRVCFVAHMDLSLIHISEPTRPY